MGDESGSVLGGLVTVSKMIVWLAVFLWDNYTRRVVELTARNISADSKKVPLPLM